MNAMATTTHPAELRLCRVVLATGPAAPAEARTQVRTAIRNWEVPVDPFTPPTGARRCISPSRSSPGFPWTADAAHGGGTRGDGEP